jgi:hypothetical protein
VPTRASRRERAFGMMCFGPVWSGGVSRAAAGKSMFRVRWTASSPPYLRERETPLQPDTGHLR